MHSVPRILQLKKKLFYIRATGIYIYIYIVYVRACVCACVNIMSTKSVQTARAPDEGYTTGPICDLLAQIKNETGFMRRP